MDNTADIIETGRVVLGYLIALAIVIFMFFTALRKPSRKRQQQRQQDESIILNLYNQISLNDYRIYKDLPSYTARLAFLCKEYPDFMAAVHRSYSEDEFDFVIADNLDIRMLSDEENERKDAIRIYRNTARVMSINEYQKILDKNNAEYRAMVKHSNEIREKARLERESREAEEDAIRKAGEKAATEYWNSLTEEQKTSFKKASGKSSRLTTISPDFYHLYPFIMTSQFPAVCENPSVSATSIDNCESSLVSTFNGDASTGSSVGSSDSGGASGGGGE